MVVAIAEDVSAQRSDFDNRSNIMLHRGASGSRHHLCERGTSGDILHVCFELNRTPTGTDGSQRNLVCMLEVRGPAVKDDDERISSSTLRGLLRTSDSEEPVHTRL